MGKPKGKGKGDKGGGKGGKAAPPQGPPDEVIEIGEFMLTSEDDMVCKCTIKDQVPKFNVRIFLKNKTQIGQVDEIFGPINKFMFTVKTVEGVAASSYETGKKVFIDKWELLPMARFLPGAEAKGKGKGKGKGGKKGGKGGGKGKPKGGGKGKGKGKK